MHSSVKWAPPCERGKKGEREGNIRRAASFILKASGRVESVISRRGVLACLYFLGAISSFSPFSLSCSSCSSSVFFLFSPPFLLSLSPPSPLTLFPPSLLCLSPSLLSLSPSLLSLFLYFLLSLSLFSISPFSLFSFSPFSLSSL